MHEFWRYILLVIGCIELRAVKAQQNELAYPALLDFNLNVGSSATFHAAKSSNKTYITLNICSLPSRADFDTLQDATVLFVFNSSDVSLTPMATARSVQGFANLTLAKNTEHWITVNAPASANTSASASWGFEIGASTTEPMHIVNPFPYYSYADSGNTSALFSSSTYFPTLQNRKAAVFLMLPTSQRVLSQSSCFISSQTSLTPRSAIQLSNTTRGVFTLSAREGATGTQLAKNQAGGIRDQYFIQDLEPGTNYTVWGMQETGQEANTEQVISNGNPQGMQLYAPQYFVTKTTPNCRLLFQYPTCPNLAYAAPSPPEIPLSALYETYDALLAPHLANFNLTLTQFPCDIPEQNRFSSVRTCTDCLAAYTDWVCAMIVPQCTDIPQNQLAQAQANYTTFQNQADQLVFSNLPIPSNTQTKFIRDDPALSRTPQFSIAGLANLTNLTSFSPTPPFPYAEIPPCSSICNLVGASCPWLINWNCPLRSQTMTSSYGQLQMLSAQDLSGGNQAVTSQWGRSSDRFGNFFCNAMESDVLLDVRTSHSTRIATSLLAPVLVAILFVVT